VAAPSWWRIASDAYTISAMDLWDIEVKPEVRAWLEALPRRQFGHVLAFAEKLAEEAATLGEPYSRHLGGKVRELRIPLHPVDVRVTYWLAPGRRVVLLTVFRKTRAQETAEIERAQRVQKECEASRGHATDVFEREA
jgi:hypothetical protein